MSLGISSTFPPSSRVWNAFLSSALVTKISLLSGEFLSGYTQTGQLFTCSFPSPLFTLMARSPSTGLFTPDKSTSISPKPDRPSPEGGVSCPEALVASSPRERDHVTEDMPLPPLKSAIFIAALKVSFVLQQYFSNSASGTISSHHPSQSSRSTVPLLSIKASRIPT